MTKGLLCDTMQFVNLSLCYESTSHFVAVGYRGDHIKQGEIIMRKLTYETPELRIALTEADIKANEILDSSEWGGEIPGIEIPEDTD